MAIAELPERIAPLEADDDDVAVLDTYSAAVSAVAETLSELVGRRVGIRVVRDNQLVELPLVPSELV